VTDARLHALRKLQVVTIAGDKVAPGLRDPNDRPARLKLLPRQAVVEKALQVERRHLWVLGVVPPGPAPEISPSVPALRCHSLPEVCTSLGSIKPGRPGRRTVLSKPV